MTFFLLPLIYPTVVVVLPPRPCLNWKTATLGSANKMGKKDSRESRREEGHDGILSRPTPPAFSHKKQIRMSNSLDAPREFPSLLCVGFDFFSFFESFFFRRLPLLFAEWMCVCVCDVYRECNRAAIYFFGRLLLFEEFLE